MEENQKKCLSCCCPFLFIIIFSIVIGGLKVIEPTQYGLLKKVGGAVDLDKVYTGGRHYIGPLQSFITFPRERLTLSYGPNSNDDQVSILARTGADQSAVSSGGQPVTLSVSFQYTLVPELIPQLFQTFGSLWETSYLRFAQQAITNVAQLYTPRMFWEDRAAIERAMFLAINETIYTQGFAVVPHLQLRSVGFQGAYETTIIDIQVQKQLEQTKRYQLLVTEVEKEIDVLQAETDATITEINADATRQRDIIVGQANADALEREQSTRATMYRRMRDHLGWEGRDFLAYAKMKALNAQPQGNVVVGVNAVGSVRAS